LKKLIALDLDGTLLNRNSEISGENIRAIRDAQQHGMEVVIATGRAHFDVREIFKDTGIRTWVIAANGATIHDPEGKLFFPSRWIKIGQSKFWRGSNGKAIIMK